MMRWFRRRTPPHEEFRLHRTELLQGWFAAAAASSVPRGLAWLTYTEAGEVVWANTASEVVPLALVPVVVEFEPVIGGPLEDVPQAREPRPVVAVFRWNGRAWIADGRAYFNLSPRQMIDRSGGSWVEFHPGSG